jgi:hypothetical protein
MRSSSPCVVQFVSSQKSGTILAEAAANWKSQSGFTEDAYLIATACRLVAQNGRNSRCIDIICKKSVIIGRKTVAFGRQLWYNEHTTHATTPKAGATDQG